MQTYKENTAVSLTSSTQTSSALKIIAFTNMKKSGTGKTPVRSVFQNLSSFFLIIKSHGYSLFLCILISLIDYLLGDLFSTACWNRQRASVEQRNLGNPKQVAHWLVTLLLPQQTELTLTKWAVWFGKQGSKISGVGENCCVSLAPLSQPLQLCKSSISWPIKLELLTSVWHSW